MGGTEVDVSLPSTSSPVKALLVVTIDKDVVKSDPSKVPSLGPRAFRERAGDVLCGAVGERSNGRGQVLISFGLFFFIF